LKVLLFANTDWYLWNFRRELAEALRRNNWEVVLVSPPGAYGERFLALGTRWICLQMQRDGINPLTELAAVAALSAIYRREKPDLVHHFTLKAVIHGSLAAWLAGIDARVNAIAGLGYIFCSQDYRARLLRPLVRLLLKAALAGRSSLTVFQNPEDARALTLEGVAAAARSRIIRGSGVDTARFQAQGRPQGARCRVLLATRLLWSKGVGDYVAAARALSGDDLAADFLVAGASDDGSPDSIPDKVIDGWRADGGVTFLGHVDDIDLLLKTVDVVVLPSRYAEGVPRILLEAAASSVALIATDRPGCREIVEHNVTGLLVPPGDIAALTESLRKLIIDPVRRAELGAAARRKAQLEFEESRIIEDTIGVYREALGMTGSSSGRSGRETLSNPSP
jgi:glycosyltransferase involved in cell wall biosynthesis